MNPQQTADDGSSDGGVDDQQTADSRQHTADDGGVGDQQTSELFFGPAETLTLSQTLMGPYGAGHTPG